MKSSLLMIRLSIVGILFLIVTFAADVSAFQPSAANAKRLSISFAKAVGQHFEIIKDEIKHRPRDTNGDYWLVHVKPKRSGYYSLKYSYKFIKRWSEYSSDEGENEFAIGVGGKNCHRRNNPESGISNACLGDTIIIPILTTNLTQHSFNLSFRAGELESLEKSQKYLKSRENYSSVEPEFNQLKANVKLLGTRRAEMPHRSCCAVTIDHYAIFEALKPGRFNLGFSSFKGDKISDNSINTEGKWGTPITIVALGTPITILMAAEKTIHYSNKRRFSAHAGNNFPTNLLILQPGDVFALHYSRQTLNYKLGDKFPERTKISDIKPAIYKLPFWFDKNWSFNEWLIDYLPKNK